MEKSSVKIQIDKYYGIFAALLTMGILILAMSYGQLIGGQYTYINGDLYEQCAPFARLFVNKLINHTNLYYSFKAGLGMNTSLLFAFYVFSPFNLLYLLCNGSNVSAIATLVLLLKAGMAAFSFQAYSRYNLKNGDISSVLFSVGYALAAYGIATSDMIALYDGIYLLPLILMSIRYMVIHNKSSMMVILYAILFVVNFYSGYIVGIATFGYFISLMICRDELKGVRRRLFFRYVIGVICAIMLSGFIIAPALYEALRQNAIDSTYNFRAVPIWDVISFLFPFHNYEMYAMTPYYYCGLPSTLLIGAYFTNAAIKKKYKIIGAVALAIALISMLFQPVYSAAHMFNDPTGFTFRYVYVISLVICSMGAVALRKVESINVGKAFGVVFFLTIVHCFTPIVNKLLHRHNNSPSLFFYVVTLGLVVIWIAIFFVYRRATKRDFSGVYLRCLSMISVIAISFEMCANTYVLLTTNVHQKSDEFNYRVAQADLLNEELGKIDLSFYRVHYDGLMNMNQACLYDYYGTTLYASSGNENLKSFLYKMGISSVDFFIYGKGTTDLTKLLLNEKYNLGAYIQIDEENENYIYQNPTVGLGFMVDDKVRNVEMVDNVFENQNIVYSALYGSDIYPFAIYDGDVSYDGENVVVDNQNDTGTKFSLKDGESIGYIRVSMPAARESEVYAWLSSGVNNVNVVSPVIFSPDKLEECDYVKPLLTAPHIIMMSKEEDEYAIYVYLAENTVKSANISECRIAYYDNSFIYGLWDKLSQQSFNIETIEDGLILGNITANEPGICFLSIPYEEGWSAIVDGERREIVPLFNDAFIGVPVNAGYHEIELRFDAPFSKLGIALSVVGLAILLVIICGEYLKVRKKAM